MPKLPSYRDQSIDLPCKSIDWFLYDGNFGFLWVKLISVVPATNTANKISFSFLWLVTPFLRVTTGQGLLNYLMFLSTYKENVDKLNLKNVIRKFVLRDVEITKHWPKTLSFTHSLIWKELRPPVPKKKHFLIVITGNFNVKSNSWYCPDTSCLVGNTVDILTL